MPDATNVINSMAQFLQGYLRKKEEIEQREKEEKQRKKMEENINSGKYNVTQYINSEGKVSYTLKPKSEVDTQLRQQRDAVRKYETNIKYKIANQEVLDEGEMNYAEDVLGIFVPEFSDPSKVAEKDTSIGDVIPDVRSWDDVSLIGRITSALSPSASPYEKQLGGLRLGGIIRPPRVGPTKAAPQTAPKSNLPTGVTEEDIRFTMEKHGVSREEVLKRLKER